MPYDVKDTLLERKVLVLAKEESTYGTDPVPSQATDVMLALDLAMSKPRAWLDREPAVGPYLGRVQGLVGERHGEVSFGVEIIGSLAGTKPIIHPLLLACGMKKIQGDSTLSYIYQPGSKWWPSTGEGPRGCTIYVYTIESEGDEAILEKFTGCIGNLVINSTQSQILRFNFTFSGLYNAATKVSSGFISPTIPSQLPLKAQDITLQLGGTQVDVPVEAFEINMQNEINSSSDLSGTYGIVHYYLTSRNPIGSLNPELSNSSSVLAPTTVESDIDTPTTESFRANYIRGSRGLQITAPVLVKKDAAWAARNGVRIYNIPFQLAQQNGDDEIKLEFAPAV